MGDNLAQQLFEILQLQGPDLPPFRRVLWHELSATEQIAWEQVAVHARRTMIDRFMTSVDDVFEPFNTHAAKVALRRRWGRE